jgi:predicted nuclease with TOPRIM domain
MKPNSAAADAKAQTEASIEHWQQRCAELTEERDRLRQKLAEMKGNYEVVRKSLAFLMRRDVELDDEELLAQSGKVQSLRELIEELEAQYGEKEAS